MPPSLETKWIWCIEKNRVKYEILFHKNHKYPNDDKGSRFTPNINTISVSRAGFLYGPSSVIVVDAKQMQTDLISSRNPVVGVKQPTFCIFAARKHYNICINREFPSTPEIWKTSATERERDAFNSSGGTHCVVCSSSPSACFLFCCAHTHSQQRVVFELVYISLRSVPLAAK